MNEESKYLILIVGENPLPVYVAAMNNCMDTSIIYLVHTEETEDSYGSKFFANSIKKTLRSKKTKTKVNLKRTDRSNAEKIIKTAQEIVKEIDDMSTGEENIFFYYNGGTKNMDNYFYYLLKDFENRSLKFKNKIIYKYEYDAKLKYDKEISIKDICSIHGYKLTNKDDEIIKRPHMEIVKNAKLKGNNNSNIDFSVLIKKEEKIKCVKIVDDIKKNDCKFKLFKTIYDAEKIGGSKTEVKFYCCCKDMKDLQREVDDMGYYKNRIEIVNLVDNIANNCLK